MNIPLQRLEGFYWVARHQGYARAARAFPYPITQPGVHQQVKRLEEALGVALFTRVGKDKVVLTAAGQALFAFVAPFVEQWPSVVKSLNAGTFGGTLKIAAAGMLLRALLPKWLRQLHEKHPEIAVELAELRRADVEVLRTGEADLLVDHFPEVPEDVAVQQVGLMRTFLVLPSNHALAERKRLTLRELASDTFISYSAASRLQALQLRALAVHGKLPKRTYSADSSDTILGFVAAGVGYSLVPSLEVNGPKLSGVVALPFEVQGSTFPIYAGWRKHAPKNPFVEAALKLAPQVRRE